MKTTLLIPSILVSLVVPVFAEPAKSVITTADGSKTVFIDNASDKGISYLQNPNSYYEMESVRREQNYAELGKLLNSFRPDSLVNENYLTQLQIYPYWEAYDMKAWKRILQMYGAWDKKKLPGYQKAQISYCYGMALMETGNKPDALLEFNKTIALSEYKELELVLKAGGRIMDIMLEDKALLDCLATHKTAKADMSSRAYLRLLEAHSIAKFWDESTAASSLPVK